MRGIADSMANFVKFKRAGMGASAMALLAAAGSGCAPAIEPGDSGDDVARSSVAEPLAPLQLSVLAGAVGQSGSTDGVGAAARFQFLFGVTTNADSDLSVIEGLAVRRISPAAAVTTFSALPTYGSDPPDLPDPRGVAVDASDAVYVSNNNVYTVDKIQPNGTITTVAGHLFSQSDPSDLDHPEGLALDASGNLYVADTFKNRIVKVTPAGVFSELPQPQFGQFSSPRGVAVDRDGGILVADTGNFVIRRIAPSGQVSTIAGVPGEAGHVDGPYFHARFSAPNAIATSLDGSVYVADGTTIRKLTPWGDVSTFVGVSGQSTLALGPLPASLEAPSGVAITPAGNLAITELLQHVVLTVQGAGPDCSAGQCSAHILADFPACANSDLQSTLGTACGFTGAATELAAPAFGAYEQPPSLDVGRVYGVSLAGAFHSENAGSIAFVAPKTDDYLIYLGTPNVPFLSDTAPVCSRYLSDARVQAITGGTCDRFRGVYRLPQVPQGTRVHIRLGKIAPQFWVRVLILPRNP